MIREYLASNFRIAHKLAWNGTNGLAGGAIGGVGLIWPGIIKFTENSQSWSEPTNWLLSFLVYALLAWVILLILGFAFIAPYRNWTIERKKNISPKDDPSIKAREAQSIEHDRQLAARVRELFPEKAKRKLVSDLLNQHAYWNPQDHNLSDVICFLDSAEAHFIEPIVSEKAAVFLQAAAKLLEFMGRRFFVYPRERNDEPRMYAMQPSWNLDREGDGSEEQQDKYDKLTDELESYVHDMSTSFEDLIKAFHSQLLA